MQDPAAVGYAALPALRVERSNDLVYQRLREAIISGAFTPGQRLVEARLGERFGVSRAPIREAFRSLASEGLIESIPRRGVFVVSLSREDAAEIYGLRSALECWAVREACDRVTDADASALLTLVHAMESSSNAHARDLLVDEDVEFHRKICVLSGNGRLLSTWLGVAGQIQLLSKHVIGSLYSDLDVIPRRHDAIVEAIRPGNQEQAERVMREHIESVASSVISTLRNSDRPE